MLDDVVGHPSLLEPPSLRLPPTRRPQPVGITGGWSGKNLQEYVEDYRKRRGEDAMQPHRIRYKPLTRQGILKDAGRAATR